MKFFFIIVAAAVLFPVMNSLALEAVAQGDAGGGSVFAGIAGAINARADALQANQAATNAKLNDQAEQIRNLQDKVSQTIVILRQLQEEGGAGNSSQSAQSVVECASQGRLWNGVSCVAQSLQCRVVRADASGSGLWSIASCAADEVVTGGGGLAEVPNSDICASNSAGFLHSSYPYGNGWLVDGYQYNWSHDVCTRGFAVCCKIVMK